MPSEELLELLVYLDVMIDKGLEELSFIITNRKWQLCEAVKTFWPEFCKKLTSKLKRRTILSKQRGFFGPSFFSLQKLDEIALKLLFLVTSGWLLHYIQAISYKRNSPVIVIITLATTTKWKKMHWCEGVWHSTIATLAAPVRSGTGFKCKRGP